MWSFKQKKGLSVPTAIHFDDDFSKRCTIMEIVAQDAFGLLYRIASVLASHGCNIEVALITTEGHRALDVFYITRQGSKLATELEEELKSGIGLQSAATKSPPLIQSLIRRRVHQCGCCIPARSEGRTHDHRRFLQFVPFRLPF